MEGGDVQKEINMRAMIPKFLESRKLSKHVSWIKPMLALFDWWILLFRVVLIMNAI